jgi:glycosyltransferase involved in cell wall biosynthesis
LTVSDAPELTIVLPVFNEGESIARVLGGLAREVRTSHEVLVVYDFAEDTTVPPVRALAMPTVRLVRNEIGRGVLNAMRSGIAAARAPLVLISMADGSDDPAVIDPMVQRARDGADVVAASRYMRGGRQEGGPFMKTLLSRAAGLSLHHLAGLPVHDATSNFRLYRRSLLEQIPIESQAGFELALELTVKAYLRGARLAEIPTVWRDRTAGTSKFRLRAWLPGYLRWYLRAFAGRFTRRAAA